MNGLTVSEGSLPLPVAALALASPPVARPELAIFTSFTEQQLCSREIENQSKVLTAAGEVPLWLALKAVLEDCLADWLGALEFPSVKVAEEITRVRHDKVKEIDRLTLLAFENPLELKAVARVTQLGLNARRTLDHCWWRLLNPAKPSRSSVPVRLDWAVGGIAHWPEAPSYSFEEGLPVEFVKNDRFYSTDKTVRKDISTKQIANIFCIKEHVIDSIEARALREIRRSFQGDTSISEYALDFLASS